MICHDIISNDLIDTTFLKIVIESDLEKKEEEICKSRSAKNKQFAADDQGQTRVRI